MTPYVNSEGYPDPTAGKALASISRKERGDRRKKKRKEAVSKKVEMNEKTGTGSVSGTG